MDRSGLNQLVPLNKRDLIIRKFSLKKPTRKLQQRALANKWLTEKENTRYRYYVEQCSDGKRIFLARPTRKNKGFDFTIALEGYRNKAEGRNSDQPKHEHIIDDLKLKNKESVRKVQKISKGHRFSFPMC